MKTAVKIIGNILVAFLMPGFLAIWKFQKIIQAIKTGYYSEGFTGYPDYPVTDMKDIFSHIYDTNRINDTFIIIPLTFLIVVLTPLQLYQDSKYEKGLKITFLKKWLILSIPFIIITILSVAAYMYGSNIKEIFKILIIAPTSFALYIIILKYLLIDIWTEKIIQK